MNIHDIIHRHLSSIGADGLCSEDCGCSIDNLAPCADGNVLICTPARHVMCKDCKLDSVTAPDSCERDGRGCYQPLEAREKDKP